MTTPLNGPLEVAIRVLMVLVEAFPEHLDLNRLVLLDHGLLHSADLGGPESLHPPVPIRAGELGIKRELVQGGVEVLVRSGLAQMETGSDGIRFWASENAEGFARLLETEHACALSSRAAWVVNHFANLSDDAMRETMRTVSGHWAEEFGHIQSPLNGAV
ncbi:hypothetical protein O4J56_04775 [Nocardiopsis sp. RSe5-2]|uniref:Threonine transporter n=1 Tax=Nocardiopsis endophytica TaxID=3018445 RepID=A0ABT4TZ11_9ACTN|nr:ABC-three component system middle component 2 [Nocardiopsis endophytica]MDA2809943.1 hypothetical protein [Nocardiopsis endophytica]